MVQLTPFERLAVGYTEDGSANLPDGDSRQRRSHYRYVTHRDRDESSPVAARAART